MLTVAMEVSLSMEQSDYLAIIERFEHSPYDECRLHGYYLVNSINRYLTTSVTCNLAALVISISLYLCIPRVSASSPSVPVPRHARRANEDEWDRALMWRWIRVPVLLVCGMVVWGSGDTVSAWKYRHFSLIPNQHVEEKGSCSHTGWDPDFQTTKGFFGGNAFRDTWGLFEGFYITVFFIAYIVSASCVSWGTYQASKSSTPSAAQARESEARRSKTASERELGLTDALTKLRTRAAVFFSGII